MFDRQGYTPLILTIREGDVGKVRHLLKEGQSPNLPEKEEPKWTPMIFAVDLGILPIVEALLEYGANVDDCDFYKKTALMHAAYASKYHPDADHPGIITLLLQYGADVDYQVGYDKKGRPLQDTENLSCAGMSALHMSAGAYTFDIMKILIAYGANVNIKDINNRTPISFMMEERPFFNDEGLNMLLEAKADVNILDTAGKSPVNYAINRYAIYDYSKNRIESLYTQIKLLFDLAGARSDTLTIDERTLLHSISFNDHTGYPEKILDLIIEKIPDNYINLADKSGNTALMLASHSGDFNAVKKLIKHGAVGSQVNKKGETALFTYYSNIITFLIEKNHVDINHQDNEGNTAFMCYLQRKTPNIEAICAFLTCGRLNIELQNNKGKTIFDIASEHQYLPNDTKEEILKYEEEKFKVSPLQKVSITNDFKNIHKLDFNEEETEKFCSNLNLT